jgi:16S rRNA G1207 methylase RsmC
MANGFCKTLCLADINPEAVEACRRTVADNRLEARVSVYASNNLRDIPDGEKWDLVVSNPPRAAALSTLGA